MLEEANSPDHKAIKYKHKNPITAKQFAVQRGEYNKSICPQMKIKSLTYPLVL